jgi:hypothetical protein
VTIFTLSQQTLVSQARSKLPAKVKQAAPGPPQMPSGEQSTGYCS